MSEGEPTYRPEYVTCLRLIARACDTFERLGYRRPVIVGGAAVEFYTGGAIVSGDFDLVTPRQAEFEDALVAAGFVRENRSGRLSRGLYHPEFSIGVEIVSGALFDGRADPLRIRLIDVLDGSRVAVAPLEDIIADRMGQYAMDPRAGPDMREQARMLYRLARNLDESYLDRRIREETLSEFGLRDLEAEMP